MDWLYSPSRNARIAAAIVVAVFGASLAWNKYETPGFRSDFEILHFGATKAVRGIDPYPLVGPGREYDLRFRLIYPGPAVALAVPFVGLTPRAATAAFVALSAFVLVFGVTKRGLFILPVFGTELFTNAATIGQWSILATAVLFYPALAFLAVAKPQSFIPAIFGGKNLVTALGASVIGGMALAVVSFLLIPSWPEGWITALRETTGHMRPVLFRPFGFLALLALLRWRRRETWLIVSLVLMPQTWGWYNALPLIVVPRTLTQVLTLFVIAQTGLFAGALLMPDSYSTEESFFSWVNGLVMLTVYLPVVVMVLRRPNEYHRALDQSE